MRLKERVLSDRTQTVETSHYSTRLHNCPEEVGSVLVAVYAWCKAEGEGMCNVSIVLFIMSARTDFEFER